MKWSGHSDGVRLGAAVLAIAAITLVLGEWLRVANVAIVSTTYLMVVLLVAATSRLGAAVATSIAAMLCLNFFFLPPVGTLVIADPEHWAALFAFLGVSLVASHLSSVARARTQEALGRRDELARLFDLSRDVLMMTDSRDALAALARAVARRFDLEFVAIAVPRGGDWEVHEAGAQSLALDTRELSQAFSAAHAALTFDAGTGADAGHRTMTVHDRRVRLVPLRVGPRPTGLLAASGRPVEAGTIAALAGVVALAIERAELLEERKASELTRQSEQLKTALLASLGHDLRTPLTAIRVAASNIKASHLTREERFEQSDLILSEVERLTRLFQNLLEMARIDAGAIATETRWTHPSEIVAAARDQVEQTLQGHRVAVTIERDLPLRLDPRLTATALAHLLENAAQYSPPRSTIHVTADAGDEGLVLRVRDEGPGIAPADLPRVFDRFYRGDAAKMRKSGIGMGLWIVRKLLAAEAGRVAVENTPHGGAQFAIVVPAAVKEPEPASWSH